MPRDRNTKSNPDGLRMGGLPSYFPNGEWSNANKDLKKEKVLNYLKENPFLINEYIMESAEMGVLEELLRKKRNVRSPNINVPRTYPYALVSTKEMSSILTKGLSEPKLHHTLENVCQVLAQILKADSYNIYISDSHASKVYSLKKGDLGIVSLEGTVSGCALKEEKTVMVDILKETDRYPNCLGTGISSEVSVLSIPVCLLSKESNFVFELIRTEGRLHFDESDLNTAHALTGWLAACINENREKNSIHNHRLLIDFLLETTKDLFEDMTSSEKLVHSIMMFTKNLVEADRCSMFLVDEEKNELYAIFFDEGAKSSTGTPIFTKTEQIRFSRNKGIAGHVAMTGEIVNVNNAYSDKRFNPEVDKITGFKTQNILCMPIINRGKVQGVVEMINVCSTKTEHFTRADENAMRMFTGYCAFALNYSNMYNLLKKQQNLLKVSLEMLEFHSVCQKSEVKALLEDPHIADENIPNGFYSFSFYPNKKHDDELPKLFIRIIAELFGREKFDTEKLCRFVLTVKLNYRDVAYHNWYHGFNVAHSLWRMIETHKEFLTPFEQMAIVISGICHDMDHRGFNNSFFVQLKLPLANLYSTSVMEQHHYRQTVKILQSEGHDIFSFMEPEAYKSMLQLIRHCILSTDLALYFDVQKSLQVALDDKSFGIENSDHRSKVLSLMMTASDLCGISKPWKDNSKSTNNLYTEFYQQGDQEKRHGIQPMPMMNRENVAEIPKQQLGFIDFICKPLYTTLTRILPKTKPLLDACLKNREEWQKCMETQETQV